MRSIFHVHVKGAASDSATNIENLLALLQIQHLDKFARRRNPACGDKIVAKDFFVTKNSISRVLLLVQEFLELDRIFFSDSIFFTLFFHQN